MHGFSMPATCEPNIHAPKISGPNTSDLPQLPASLWPALSALIGEAWPPVSDAGVAAFVRGAAAHRLLAIAAADGSLPEAVRVSVAEQYAAVAAAQTNNDRDVDRLLARLPGLMTGEWLGVNGVDFRRRLYPSPHLRPMNDIDLLMVRADDAPDATRQLVAHGFTLRPPLAGSYDISLDPPARGGPRAS